jgi:hypothetical protein
LAKSLLVTKDSALEEAAVTRGPQWAKRELSLPTFSKKEIFGFSHCLKEFLALQR